GEVSRCLDEAWNRGFEIQFKPHLDFENNFPRGLARFRPDSRYISQLFSEFVEWVGNRNDSIGHAPVGSVRVVLSAEQELSTALNPEAWTSAALALRERLDMAGVSRPMLPIGLNMAALRIAAQKDCGSYADLLDQIDFMSPSVYEDWSQVHRGEDQIRRGLDRALARQMRAWSWHEGTCEGALSRLTQLSWVVGEFGVGPSLRYSMYWGRGIESLPRDPESLAEYELNRRQLYKNLIEHLKKRPRWEQVYIWTNNIHDPVGVSASPDGTAQDVHDDPTIADLFRSYQAWNCH
ncbi:MAG: hypothetical protein KGQ59_12065, partial [Bdellovibrionales bacterium]|nr:hypothetical protein [Bdellovibrionales bacterium]